MQMRARNRSASLSKAALIAGVFLFSALGARGQSDDAPPGEWRIAGQNLSNSWSQPAEHTINPSNVNRLTQNGCSRRAPMFPLRRRWTETRFTFPIGVEVFSQSRKRAAG